jgi:hypothetical protein
MGLFTVGVARASSHREILQTPERSFEKHVISEHAIAPVRGSLNQQLMCWQ